MKTLMVSFFVGFLFAIGLGISGMTQPEKVIGFLDIFGNWDPSLMFVMIGAIGVHLFAYLFIIKKKSTPILSAEWHLPKHSKITKSLVIGSLLFGFGWGLAGYCPGPSIVSAVTLNEGVLVFVLSMIFGMVLYRAFLKVTKERR